MLQPQHSQCYSHNTHNITATTLTILQPQHPQCYSHNTQITTATTRKILQTQHAKYYSHNTHNATATTHKILQPQHAKYYRHNTHNTHNTTATTLQTQPSQPSLCQGDNPGCLPKFEWKYMLAFCSLLSYSIASCYVIFVCVIGVSSSHAMKPL